MATEARRIVEDVLGNHMTAKIWTGSYAPVFPFTPQGYAIGPLLPVVLYLFRWGHRRGRGKFNAAFGGVGKATIQSVAARLIEGDRFEGFGDGIGRAVLGDMLLSSTLENRRHAEGHEEQVQRCFPNHYMASWIDLPTEATALRGVPEMIVALVNGQPEGELITPFQNTGRYRVGARVEDNEFTHAFAPGISTTGRHQNDLRSDTFDESTRVGLDQLITIRLAQGCGEAPSRAVGRGMPGPISNQRPIATRAALAFREDLLTFFDCYGRGNVTPRLALMPMLEASIAIGTTSIVLSTVSILNQWVEDGSIPHQDNQQSLPMFVDCSGGTDFRLRDYSEQSWSLIRHAMNRVPSILMYMRLLDFWVSTEAEIPRAQLPPQVPDATIWLNLLGKIASGGHEESRDAERFFRSKARALIEAGKADTTGSLRTDVLQTENDGRSHGRRLSEVLTVAFEQVAGGDKLGQFFSSSLMTDEPNGLARRRRVVLRRTPGVGQSRTGDILSFVFTNTVLEYLVHRHLRRTGKGRKPRGLSYPEFLNILRDRYGFYVDQAPPNLAVPNELLERNRLVLERRLRDLGVLTGVNDAERMKKLRPRYRSATDEAGTGAVL